MRETTGNKVNLKAGMITAQEDRRCSACSQPLLTGEHPAQPDACGDIKSLLELSGVAGRYQRVTPKEGECELATRRCLAGHARQRLTHVLPGIYAGRERQGSSTCHVPGHLLTHSSSSCAVFLEQAGLDIILYALKADIVAHRRLLIIGDRNRGAVLEHAHHRECIR